MSIYAFALPSCSLAILLNVSPGLTVYVVAPGAAAPPPTALMSATTSCCQVGIVLMASQILLACSWVGTVPLKYSLPSRSSAEPSIPKLFAVSIAYLYRPRSSMVASCYGLPTLQDHRQDAAAGERQPVFVVPERLKLLARRSGQAGS